MCRRCVSVALCRRRARARAERLLPLGLADGARRGGLEDLVGVDREDPVAAGVPQRLVARGGEVVAPREVVLVCLDPGLDAPRAFLRRLAGLVKYALREYGGRAVFDEDDIFAVRPWTGEPAPSIFEWPEEGHRVS